MNFRSPLSPLALVLALGLASTALPAQTVEDEKPPSPTRYAIELVLFRHLDQSRNTPEIRLPQPETEANSLPGAAVPVREAPVTFHVMELHAEPPDFTPLPDGETVLDDVFRRLTRLEAYDVLAHLGWSQQGRAREIAGDYYIPASVTTQTGISGTVKFFKERYAHLAVDLELRTPPPATITGSAPERLVESRRIRGSSAQYFDHPRFGVIANIREIEPESLPVAPAKNADTTGSG